MGDVLVELLVFLVLDFSARTGPQGAGAVNGFPFQCRRFFAFGSGLFFRQLDRQGDVVGVLFDDVAQAPAIGELFFAGLEVQNDLGAALGFSTVATSNSPSPLEAQCTPSLAGVPARRLNTSTLSATIKAE
jgi:hypothetical protein